MKRKLMASLVAVCLFVGMIVPSFAASSPGNAATIDLGNGESQSINAKVKASSEAYYNKFDSTFNQWETALDNYLANLYVEVGDVEVTDSSKLYLSDGGNLEAYDISSASPSYESSVSIGHDAKVWVRSYKAVESKLYISIFPLMFAEPDAEDCITLSVDGAAVAKFKMPARNTDLTVTGAKPTTVESTWNKYWKLGGSLENGFQVWYDYSQGEWNTTSQWPKGKLPVALDFSFQMGQVDADTAILTKKDTDGSISYGLSGVDSADDVMTYYHYVKTDRKSVFRYQLSTLEYGPSTPIDILFAQYDYANKDKPQFIEATGNETPHFKAAGARAFYACGHEVTVTKNLNGTGSLITWDGGEAAYAGTDLIIYGGGYDDHIYYPATSVTVEKDAPVLSVFGGSYGYGKVGESNVVVNGAKFSENGTPGIQGGGAAYVNSDGTPIQFDECLSADTARNQVGVAKVTVNGGTAAGSNKPSVYGGTNSYGYVGETNVIIKDGDIERATGGGSNGYVGKASLTIQNGTVAIAEGGNRGTVNEASVTVEDGEVSKLYAGAAPWETGDPSPYAKVNRSVVTVKGGTVTELLMGHSDNTALAQGKAKVTYAPAATIDNEADLETLFGAENVTKEKVSVTGVSLNKNELKFTEAGASETLVATVQPEDATNKAVTWESDDTAVATVENGKVTAIGEGTATITVKTTDGGHTATCEVTVTLPEPPPPEEDNYTITLDFDETKGSVTLNPNKTVVTSSDSVTVTVTPEADYEVSSVKVNGEAKQVAKEGGSFTLNNFSDNVRIAVTFSEKTTPPPTPVAVTGVTLDKSALSFTEIGASETLSATVQPEDATNKAVTWESSNTAVATVENGKVTAAGEGTATIMVKTVDGEFKATCTVNVKLPEPSVTEFNIVTSITGKGSVTALTKAGEGAVVEVKATADSGNEVKSVVVQFHSDGAVIPASLVAGKVNTWQFTMPAGDVDVAVTFGAIPAPTPTPGNSGSTTTPSEPVAPPEIDTESAVEDIKSADTKEVSVKISEPDVVKEDIFAAAKDNDKTIVFDVVDSTGKTEYKWEFEGAAIELPQIATSLEVRIDDVADLAAEKLPEEVKTKNALFVEFMHSGLLPGKASVTLNVSDKFKEGDAVYFYYYNKMTNQFELVAKDLKVADGYVTVPMTHCSEYVLSDEEIAGAVDTTGSSSSSSAGTSNPQTGDSNPTGLMAAMLIALLGCGIVLKKKVFVK